MESQNRIPGVLSGRIGDLSHRIEVLEEMLGRLKTLDMNAHELQYIIYSYAEMIKEGLVLIQDEIVIWANKAACHMLGYELEEVVNRSAVELSHPRVRQQLSARFAMVQAGDEIPTGAMWPLITKTREVKFVKPFSYRVIYMGRPAIMAFYYDVTEEMKIQEDLAMRAEMLELVNELVFVLDARGDIIYANKAMYESLGYTREEMIGRNIIDFHDKHDAERVKLRLKLATPTSQGKYRLAYVCKDGHLMLASSSGKVINLNGTEYILGVARPVDPHDATI